ncbi:MAG: hypothetical protein GC200_11650 [Tepidisphaera sp.]|nr:hypothetical protein [Tepidisphaera sp.]
MTKQSEPEKMSASMPVAQPGATPTYEAGAAKPSNPGAGAAFVTLVILYGAALVLSVAMALRGKYDLGVQGILLVLTMAPVAFVLAILAFGARQRAWTQQLADLSRAVRVLNEQASLSDDARRILNRGAEREVLCRAIEEDISAQNWDAALVLVKELADRFGYRAEAEQFRSRIDESRRQTRNAEISDAIGYLDGLILQRRWDEAMADAGRIMRLYPDSPRVESLRNHVAEARANHKRGLERRFLEASQEGKSDEALELLRELDQYLSPAEAEPLRELARGVIGKARENLGAQFKLAVQDKRWGQAARIGEQIISQFPNTRMAGEVRGVIDGIREKASAMSGV